MSAECSVWFEATAMPWPNLEVLSIGPGVVQWSAPSSVTRFVYSCIVVSSILLVMTLVEVTFWPSWISLSLPPVTN
jgi:hypothetical protein